jgi:hypothetical protein
MLNLTASHFKRPAFLSVAVLFLALIAVDASAQTENGKIEEINSRNTDKIILEDHTVINDNSSSSPLAPKVNVTQKVLPTLAKKDLISGEIISEKEVKRNDSPSTLSFNIFLYIVDKFKAD